MRDVQLLAKGKIEGIEDQAIAEGVYEKCSHACQAGGRQLAQL